MTMVAGACLLIGCIGCIVPVVPGPVLSYCGLLCLLPTTKSPSVATLVFWGVVTALAVVLDYVVPAIGARKFHCSKWGTWGCVIGTFVGVFFLPMGLILGPFLGAFIGELIAGKTFSRSAVGGTGALIGFLSGILIKLAACIGMAISYVRCL